MSIEAMKQALEALDIVKLHYTQNRHVNDAITAIRTAIAEAENQEPVLEVVNGQINRSWDAIPSGFTGLLYTTPPAAQREPLIDSVRQMRDVQGMDGTWNCDPYMHGLYNGLEFAVSLLEQREPQFKDAPEKWLSDLPKPRIFSATEAAHGTGEKK